MSLNPKFVSISTAFRQFVHSQMWWNHKKCVNLNCVLTICSFTNVMEPQNLCQFERLSDNVFIHKCHGTKGLVTQGFVLARPAVPGVSLGRRRARKESGKKGRARRGRARGRGIGSLLRSLPRREREKPSPQPNCSFTQNAFAAHSIHNTQPDLADC